MRGKKRGILKEGQNLEKGERGARSEKEGPRKRGSSQRKRVLKAREVFEQAGSTTLQFTGD